MPNADALKELAWVATRCRDATEFRAAAIAWVDREIAVDAAVFMQLDEAGQLEGRTGLGPNDAWFDGFIGGLGTRYRGDYEAIMANLATGSFMSGPTTRLEHWAAMPERQGLEEDLMFPLNLRIGSGGLISTRGAPNGILLLARLGNLRIFVPDEAELLANAAPILSLGLTLHQRRSSPIIRELPAPQAGPPRPSLLPRRLASRALTARERCVVEYVVLGLSSREIGLALGTSPNTVRNQLASIYEKLAVASRAELVAVALKEGLVRV